MGELIYADLAPTRLSSRRETVDQYVLSISKWPQTKSTCAHSYGVTVTESRIRRS